MQEIFGVNEEIGPGLLPLKRFVPSKLYTIFQNRRGVKK